VAVRLGLLQLLLMRDQVKRQSSAWYPSKADLSTMLTPYQYNVRHCDFVGVGYTGCDSQTCWKSMGRPKNYRPAPRTRYPVIFKSKKAFKSPVARP